MPVEKYLSKEEGIKIDLLKESRLANTKIAKKDATNEDAGKKFHSCIQENYRKRLLFTDIL